ncbi:MAG: AmmeMemoRadiSam system protein A [Proteobacteria bacterium]|nr:AmmeMemoRadiSam system protein A [Pseudomonadota bacterium]
MTDDEESQSTQAILNDHGEALLKLAAMSIKYGLENAKPLAVSPDDYPPELAERGASFVTLKRDGKLRGCIGSSEAYRPLITDVSENGFRAAFKDPRFPALTPAEIDGLHLSISVLSPKSPMSFSDEANFLQSLRPNIDGLIIEDGGRRALFLPSVWAQLPEPKAFVERLKAKAGMAKGHWSETFKAWRYSADEISQDSFGDPASIWGN